MFGGALVRFVINFNKKHPEKNAKIVDYGIVMVMFPMVLLGSLIGIQLNIVLPDISVLIGLTIVLIIIAYQCIRQLMKIWRSENLKKAESLKRKIADTHSIIESNSKYCQTASELIDKSDRNSDENEEVKDSADQQINGIMAYETYDGKRYPAN